MNMTKQQMMDKLSPMGFKDMGMGGWMECVMSSGVKLQVLVSNDPGYDKLFVIGYKDKLQSEYPGQNSYVVTDVNHLNAILKEEEMKARMNAIGGELDV